ncbi:hypothetical protein FLA_1900 [Filimonas lacunae]|nr:hypothetical protein FLA_1900 [Filimonas lacunae]
MAFFTKNGPLFSRFIAKKWPAWAIFEKFIYKTYLINFLLS